MSRISSRMRWIIGIVLVILYAVSDNWPYPIGLYVGLASIVAFVVFVVMCIIFKTDGNENKEENGADHTRRRFRWWYVLVVIFIITGVSNVINSNHNLQTQIPSLGHQESSVSQKQAKEEALEPHIKDLKTDLDELFSVVSVSCSEEDYDRILVLAQVANEGMSSSAYRLKNSGDTENEEYLEFIKRLIEITESFLASVQSADMNNVHIELRLVDDVDLQNKSNYGTTEINSLVEIYDGELRYDIMKDSSPESFQSRELLTTGKLNALKQAKSYIDIMPFSYSGLVEQLEYEGYTHDEALYGANNCGADWYYQAELKAKSYLEIMAFSKSGLIEQLEFEGFTHDEAVYGAQANGY